MAFLKLEKRKSRDVNLFSFKRDSLPGWKLKEVLRSEKKMDEYIKDCEDRKLLIDPEIWQIHFSVQRNGKMAVLTRYIDEIFARYKAQFVYLSKDMIWTMVKEKLGIDKNNRCKIAYRNYYTKEKKPIPDFGCFNFSTKDDNFKEKFPTFASYRKHLQSRKKTNKDDGSVDDSQNSEMRFGIQDTSFTDSFPTYSKYRKHLQSQKQASKNDQMVHYPVLANNSLEVVVSNDPPGSIKNDETEQTFDKSGITPSASRHSNADSLNTMENNSSYLNSRITRSASKSSAESICFGTLRGSNRIRRSTSRSSSDSVSSTYRKNRTTRSASATIDGDCMRTGNNSPSGNNRSTNPDQTIEHYLSKILDLNDSSSSWMQSVNTESKFIATEASNTAHERMTTPSLESCLNTSDSSSSNQRDETDRTFDKSGNTPSASRHSNADSFNATENKSSYLSSRITRSDSRTSAESICFGTLRGSNRIRRSTSRSSSDSVSSTYRKNRTTRSVSAPLDGDCMSTGNNSPPGNNRSTNPDQTIEHYLSKILDSNYSSSSSIQSVNIESKFIATEASNTTHERMTTPSLEACLNTSDSSSSNQRDETDQTVEKLGITPSASRHSNADSLNTMENNSSYLNSRITRSASKSSAESIYFGTLRGSNRIRRSTSRSSSDSVSSTYRKNRTTRSASAPLDGDCMSTGNNSSPGNNSSTNPDQTIEHYLSKILDSNVSSSSSTQSVNTESKFITTETSNTTHERMTTPSLESCLNTSDSSSSNQRDETDQTVEKRGITPSASRHSNTDSLNTMENNSSYLNSKITRSASKSSAESICCGTLRGSNRIRRSTSRSSSDSVSSTYRKNRTTRSASAPLDGDCVSTGNNSPPGNNSSTNPDQTIEHYLSKILDSNVSSSSSTQSVNTESKFIATETSNTTHERMTTPSLESCLTTSDSSSSNQRDETDQTFDERGITPSASRHSNVDSLNTMENNSSYLKSRITRSASRSSAESICFGTLRGSNRIRRSTSRSSSDSVSSTYRKNRTTRSASATLDGDCMSTGNNSPSDNNRSTNPDQTIEHYLSKILDLNDLSSSWIQSVNTESKFIATEASYTIYERMTTPSLESCLNTSDSSSSNQSPDCTIENNLSKILDSNDPSSWIKSVKTEAKFITTETSNTTYERMTTPSLESCLNTSDSSSSNKRDEAVQTFVKSGITPSASQHSNADSFNTMENNSSYLNSRITRSASRSSAESIFFGTSRSSNRIRRSTSRSSSDSVRLRNKSSHRNNRITRSASRSSVDSISSRNNTSQQISLSTSRKTTEIHNKQCQELGVVSSNFSSPSDNCLSKREDDRTSVGKPTSGYKITSNELNITDDIFPVDEEKSANTNKFPENSIIQFENSDFNKSNKFDDEMFEELFETSLKITKEGDAKVTREVESGRAVFDENNNNDMVEFSSAVTNSFTKKLGTVDVDIRSNSSTNRSITTDIRRDDYFSGMTKIISTSTKKVMKNQTSISKAKTCRVRKQSSQKNDSKKSKNKIKGNEVSHSLSKDSTIEVTSEDITKYSQDVEIRSGSLYSSTKQNVRTIPDTSSRRTNVTDYSINDDAPETKNKISETEVESSKLLNYAVSTKNSAKTHSYDEKHNKDKNTSSRKLKSSNKNAGSNNLMTKETSIANMNVEGNSEHSVVPTPLSKQDITSRNKISSSKIKINDSVPRDDIFKIEGNQTTRKLIRKSHTLSDANTARSHSYNDTECNEGENITFRKSKYSNNNIMSKKEKSIEETSFTELFEKIEIDSEHSIKSLTSKRNITNVSRNHISSRKIKITNFIPGYDIFETEEDKSRRKLSTESHAVSRGNSSRLHSFNDIGYEDESTSSSETKSFTNTAYNPVKEDESRVKINYAEFFKNLETDSEYSFSSSTNADNNTPSMTARTTKSRNETTIKKSSFRSSDSISETKEANVTHVTFEDYYNALEISSESSDNLDSSVERGLINTSNNIPSKTAQSINNNPEDTVLTEKEQTSRSKVKPSNVSRKESSQANSSSTGHNKHEALSSHRSNSVQKTIDDLVFNETKNKKESQNANISNPVKLFETGDTTKGKIDYTKSFDVADSNRSDPFANIKKRGHFEDVFANRDSVEPRELNNKNILEQQLKNDSGIEGISGTEKFLSALTPANGELASENEGNSRKSCTSSHENNILCLGIPQDESSLLYENEFFDKYGNAKSIVNFDSAVRTEVENDSDGNAPPPKKHKVLHISSEIDTVANNLNKQAHQLQEPATPSAYHRIQMRRNVFDDINMDSSDSLSSSYTLSETKTRRSADNSSVANERTQVPRLRRIELNNLSMNRSDSSPSSYTSFESNNSRSSRSHYTASRLLYKPSPTKHRKPVAKEIKPVVSSDVDSMFNMLNAVCPLDEHMSIDSSDASSGLEHESYQSRPDSSPSSYTLFGSNNSQSSGSDSTDRSSNMSVFTKSRKPMAKIKPGTLLEVDTFINFLNKQTRQLKQRNPLNLSSDTSSRSGIDDYQGTKALKSRTTLDDLNMNMLDSSPSSSIVSSEINEGESSGLNSEDFRFWYETSKSGTVSAAGNKEQMLRNTDDSSHVPLETDYSESNGSAYKRYFKSSDSSALSIADFHISDKSSFSSTCTSDTTEGSKPLQNITNNPKQKSKWELWPDMMEQSMTTADEKMEEVKKRMKKVVRDKKSYSRNTYEFSSEEESNDDFI